MNNWTLISKNLPDEYVLVETRSSDGEVNKCMLLFVEEFNKYVWQSKSGQIYERDCFTYWRPCKEKPSWLSCVINFFKKHKTPKYTWVVTCITEELDIENQQLFDDYTKAYEFMYQEYCMMCNTLAEELVEYEVHKYSATIVYGEQPYQFEWKITAVNNN